MEQTATGPSCVPLEQRRMLRFCAFLLQARAKHSKAKIDGCTALALACDRGHLEVLFLFFKAGAKDRMRSGSCHTAFSF